MTFWVLIRPGPITKLIAWLAVAIVAGVMVLLPIVTLPWEDALDKTATVHNLLPWIYGVGFAEEVTKALPILVAALLLRWVWKITLDVRIWMFLGTIAGLAFGVRESVLYTSSYLMQGNHRAGLAVPLILTFAQRVFVDGFQHAVWAGIAAFFIGMGVNYRRRRIPLILFGITLPAVLHGLNDWSTQLGLALAVDRDGGHVAAAVHRLHDVGRLDRAPGQRYPAVPRRVDDHGSRAGCRPGRAPVGSGTVRAYRPRGEVLAASRQPVTIGG